MSVKETIKKVVAKVVKPKLVVVKTEAEEVTCANCTSNGEQCYSCSPVFEDTFGK